MRDESKRNWKIQHRITFKTVFIFRIMKLLIVKSKNDIIDELIDYYDHQLSEDVGIGENFNKIKYYCE